MLGEKYITSLGGYQTYIPPVLPPQLNYPIATQRHIEQATHLLGQVEMCRSLLPNVNILLYGSLQREAIASSTIEDTIATPDELILFQVTHHAERSAVREVSNYSDALQWGCEQIPHRQLSVNFTCGLHERLLQDVRGEQFAGILKNRQNAIGQHSQSTIEDAVFIPSPPERVRDLMEELESYLQSDNAEPKVVQCALVHHQFETIHPFLDGNGRVGRLLIVLHLMQLQLLSAPMIYPSVFFERSRQEYYQRLQRVREVDDWIGWIDYFCRALISACEETIKFTKTIDTLRKSLLSRPQTDVRKRASYSQVIEAFFDQPYLKVREIADRAKITHNTVETVLEDLIREDLIMELTGKQKGRVFACRPVLMAVFGKDIKERNMSPVPPK